MHVKYHPSTIDRVHLEESGETNDICQMGLPLGRVVRAADLSQQFRKKSPKIEPPKHHMNALKLKAQIWGNDVATFKLTEVSTMNPMPEIDKRILSSRLALCSASP